MAAVLLLAAWGCGGSDGGADTARPGSGTSAATGAGSVESDEGQIREVADRVYDAYVAGDGAAVITRFYGPDPEISLTAVNVTGDRATGIVHVAGQSEGATFVRENGEWRLGA